MEYILMYGVLLSICHTVFTTSLKFNHLISFYYLIS